MTLERSRGDARQPTGPPDRAKRWLEVGARAGYCAGTAPRGRLRWLVGRGGTARGPRGLPPPGRARNGNPGGLALLRVTPCCLSPRLSPGLSCRCRLNVAACLYQLVELRLVTRL